MNIKLHYTEYGTGEPLILLHGNGEDSTYFIHQVSYFSRFYRVITIDTRGHGKSPRGNAPFTISQFADDLLHFMNDLGLEKTNLLGFSDGGNIALIFSMQNPHRISKMILNGANLNPAGVKRRIQFPVEVEYAIVSRFNTKKAKQRSELLGLMVHEPRLHRNDLKSIQIPTLVIAGCNDMIKDSHTRMIAAALPHGHLAIIDGTHFIAKENPHEFNAAVADFLKTP